MIGIFIPSKPNAAPYLIVKRSRFVLTRKKIIEDEVRRMKYVLPELLDELFKGYRNPEDIIGENGILTKINKSHTGSSTILRTIKPFKGLDVLSIK